MARGIHKVASRAGSNFVSPSGDLHAKNVSILQDPAGEIAIAPVYDIPSTAVYGDNTMALPIAGKRVGMSARHFLTWAIHLGLPEWAALSCTVIALKATETLVDDISGGDSPFDAQRTRSWVKELRNRRRLMEG